MFLLALLYRLDPANDGFVTVEQFDCACEALYHRFPIEAAICADPSSVRAALGPAGQPVPRPPPASTTTVALTLASPRSPLRP